MAYCVHELRLSEDSALKRIRAGRAARQFPAIFDLIAEGRLHLSGVATLARHLTPANAEAGGRGAQDPERDPAAARHALPGAGPARPDGGALPAGSFVLPNFTGPGAS